MSQWYLSPPTLTYLGFTDHRPTPSSTPPTPLGQQGATFVSCSDHGVMDNIKREANSAVMSDVEETETVKHEIREVAIHSIPFVPSAMDLGASIAGAARSVPRACKKPSTPVASGGDWTTYSDNEESPSTMQHQTRTTTRSRRSSESDLDLSDDDYAPTQATTSPSSVSPAR